MKKSNNLFNSNKLISGLKTGLLVFCIPLFSVLNLVSQNPIPLQVSMPVYFEDETSLNFQSAENPPIATLCGIAFLFLDTSNVQDHFIFTNLNDPIIWFDRVGISTKVSFIVSDSTDITDLELLYANNTCTVNILKNEIVIASGSIRNDFGKLFMRLTGNNLGIPDMVQLIDRLNDHLLRLHTKDQKKIPISPFYDSEALNVILGLDLSYDTDFDLLRFDETLRNRIKNIAIKTYSSIKEDEQNSSITKAIESNARVEHTAEKILGESDLLQGKISTIFKMEGEKNYMFLKSKQEYLIEIDYKYEKWKRGSGRLMIDNFSIKNLANDDFVTMSVFDFTWNGIPILYIDLINGVVMEEKGAWKASQIISVIQDVFRLIKLPNEF